MNIFHVFKTELNQKPTEHFFNYFFVINRLFIDESFGEKSSFLFDSHYFRFSFDGLIFAGRTKLALY